MPRKKKKTEPVYLPNAQVLQDDYEKELESDLQYSLTVDPLNQYNLTEEHRTFIKLYCQYKNLGFVANTMKISTEDANMYFTSYASQQEIRRINAAMYHRRFHHKMLSLDEIGGFLSSLITDENVPFNDRLNSMDKVKVAGMIVDLNKFKSTAMQNPHETDYIEETVKDMSINSIRALLAQTTNHTEDGQKEQLINSLNVDNILTPEEIELLKSMSVKELLMMINELNKGKKDT